MVGLLLDVVNTLDDLGVSLETLTFATPLPPWRAVWGATPPRTWTTS